MWEYGPVSKNYVVQSCRKSFLSALYGIYEHEGLIDLSLDMADLGIDDSVPPSLTELEKLDSEQAKIAEQAGACAVMALERVPADIRKEGGVARMASIERITAIQEADLLLAFGMRFDDRVTGNLKTYASQAKKIHVEVDASEVVVTNGAKQAVFQSFFSSSTERSWGPACMPIRNMVRHRPVR